ncbi:thioredoxin domain-containing protein [Micropruina sp.]|uniref:DsbA family protein n=1 Tax=Micropruina sp. TaxID=2737536 RepID=UPI00263759C8|nr:thioredoxin domain-containing protein [Micropruina sp.]
MPKQPTSTKSGQAREALRRRQQQQAAADRRLRIIVRTAWIAGITAIAVILGVTIWTVANARSSGSAAPPVSGPVIVPPNGTDAGAVRFGQDGAPVTVTVYADFMCPFCGQFERANGEALQSAVAAGTVKLEVHPMAFLDAQSAGSKYSTRAANAFITVASSDPDAALRFNQLLFANQPAEGSSGLSDDRLAALATQAGASADVVASFKEQRFVPWVNQLTQQAFDSGVTGTPTVKINGQPFTGDLYTPGPLANAIQQAASGA